MSDNYNNYQQDPQQGHHHHHHHQQSQIPTQTVQSSGTRVGKYQIVKTLGEGSFGKVKLAYHTTTGQRVALKIINRKTLAKSDMQGRIEREISYLRLLKHPHIIKLYDVIKSKEEIIMVIDYAGKELFDYIIQHGKMNENEARRFFQQIIAAVDYCHRHKIVHRDLKPENLLLDDQLNVKIADFGLSNIMTDGNFLKTSCGSPNYAAPEVISGKLYAGPEVDVWSCGVILYVMLCGRLPFDDESIPALFKKISNGVYTIPPDLSPGAKNLLTKMLVVNPLNRITIHEIMEDEWFKVEFPEYLLPQDLVKTKPTSASNIDPDVIAALSIAMDYSKEEIMEAINLGRRPETEEILDSYDLMKDNRALVNEIKKNNPQVNNNTDLSNQQGQRSGPQDNWRTPPGLEGNNANAHHIGARSPDFNGKSNNSSSTIAILPSSLPEVYRAFMIESNSELAHVQPITNKKSKTRWHFGIRSRSYPLDVMGEIYRALKNLGAEWVRPSDEELWTIKVRWKYVPDKSTNTDPNSNETSQIQVSPDLMKMQIQLFQLEPNNYLVDFKFDGWENTDTGENTDTTEVDEICSFSAYPFLHLSTRLIMELAVNSQS